MLPDDIRNSKVAYPADEEIKNTEIFHDPIDIIIQEYDRIWTEVMSGQ